MRVHWHFVAIVGLVTTCRAQVSITELHASCSAGAKSDGGCQLDTSLLQRKITRDTMSHELVNSFQGAHSECSAEALIATDAPLDESGFQWVAESCCHEDMKRFVSRAVDSLNLKVCNEGGLSGIVPFYACPEVPASYGALLTELAEASSPTNKCHWLAASTDSCTPPDPECAVITSKPAPAPEPVITGFFGLSAANPLALVRAPEAAGAIQTELASMLEVSRGSVNVVIATSTMGMSLLSEASTFTSLQAGIAAMHVPNCTVYAVFSVQDTSASLLQTGAIDVVRLQTLLRSLSWPDFFLKLVASLLVVAPSAHGVRVTDRSYCVRGSACERDAIEPPIVHKPWPAAVASIPGGTSAPTTGPAPASTATPAPAASSVPPTTTEATTNVPTSTLAPGTTTTTSSTGLVPAMLTCADDPSWQKPCENWVKKGLVESKCALSWAPGKCPKTCGACTLCSESDMGAWSDWSVCSATCGGGGRSRSRSPGKCTQGPFTESEQCNLQACIGDACSGLVDSPEVRIINENNAVIENLAIQKTGATPAIYVEGSSNVIIRNIHITHSGQPRVSGDNAGVGIHFKNSPNIRIENVKVELSRINPYLKDASPKCVSAYCGPLPLSMAFSYNIRGDDSPGAKMYNVHVSGGSTGIWMKNCPDSNVSHFKAENPHGANAVGGRGQCLQVVYSDRFVLEDFHCFVDNEIAFTEDTINIWSSNHSIVRRGLIDGGNAPNGVGLIMEKSSFGNVEDVDITHNGNGAFSAYGAEGVNFLRCRARSNHGLYASCASGRGYCIDWQGTNHCDGGTQRFDERGNVWYAGDYNAGTGKGQHTAQALNNQINQGLLYDMTGWDKNKKVCKSIGLTDWELAGSANAKGWSVVDAALEDFSLRIPYIPVGCAA